MDTSAPRQGPNAVALLLRALARRSRTSPTWWLAGAGTVAVVAACNSDATNTLGNNSSSTPDAGAAAPTPTASPGTPTPAGWTDGGGGGADASGPPGFDYSAFATTIQPILDTAGGTGGAPGKGCTAAACHGSATGQGGLALTRQPAPGSPEMQANFNAITALCDLNVPDQSKFYLHATTLHAGGNSAVVSQAQGSTILAWIQHAAGITAPPPAPAASDAGAGEGGTGPGGGASCIPANSFNLGVFTAEIQPILFGTLDYNQAPGTPVANNGCARGACHGSPTNPLNISTTNSPVQNLTNLACFVNLANPSASAILQCPLNNAACPKYPHPGNDVFSSPLDLNYQRIASWLYAAQGAASPLDFAFFARQIDPIFKDPTFGGLGATGNRSCSDTSTCHGVSGAGQTPPNLSNFPILADSSNKQGFLIDYWSASNFINFLTPTGSELFLFPTNLIANTNQPFETGLPHPGGTDFASNSPQAQAILQWAGGLQPDANGNLLNWLVAGTYDATLVTQSTQVGDETKLAPTIFDPDGAIQFNGGVWDLDASPQAFVDLNAEFPGAVGGGRIAYASANLLNVTGQDITQVQVSVTSPNAVLMYVGGESSQGSANGNNTVNLSTTLSSYSTSKTTTRVLVKVLQRPGDAQFGFTLNVLQQNNQPIPAGEVVVRLDPTGGN